ncbi:MAG: divalent-cation tolerance protein CutA [Candidatus Polarisedimenticolia bacterium]
MTDPPQILLVFCTVSTEKEGIDIAEALVEREQAACVNLLPMIRSVYRWKGNVMKETEQFLIIKTTQGLLDEVQKTVKELHSYELPEILAVTVADGDRDAMKWIASTVKGGRENF